MFWIILYPFLQANSGRLNYLPGTKLLSRGTELPNWKNYPFLLYFCIFLIQNVLLGVISFNLPFPSIKFSVVIENFWFKVLYLEDKENPIFTI